MSSNVFLQPPFGSSPFSGAMTRSPFAAFDDDAERAESDTLVADPEFVLLRGGPPVAAEEVESDIDAVEVTIRWGQRVLAVKHVGKGESLWLGPGEELALPEEILGAARAPVVVSRDGAAYVVVPPRARGVVATGGRTETIDALRSMHALAPSSTVGGSHEIPLLDGRNVTLEIGGTGGGEREGLANAEPIVFNVTTVRAGKVIPVGRLAALANGATGSVGLSFLGHVAVIAVLATFMPRLGADDSDAISRDQLLLMQRFLSASAERELESTPAEGGASAETSGGGGGESGEAHRGDSGASGTTKPVTTQGRSGFRGADHERALSRPEEIAEAQDFGILRLLAHADPRAPSKPWAEAYAGMDDKSAFGLFSQNIDDQFGYGLGPLGTGEGGGGPGAGYGLNGVHVGGFGPNGGSFDVLRGPGDPRGSGRGHGPGGGGHIARGPQLRPVTVTTNGRLPAEVIQRIVRQNFGRFRLCYEAGLRSNPALAGRIATRFVIGREGAVDHASDAGSDLPDQNVVSCVVRAFGALSFPHPEGGVATVTYPILLTPGD